MDRNGDAVAYVNSSPQFDERETNRKSWPASGAVLGRRFRRIVPLLKRLGIEIDQGREGHARTRIVTVRCAEPRKILSALSASSGHPTTSP